jgi:hypothetical protein
MLLRKSSHIRFMLRSEHVPEVKAVLPQVVLISMPKSQYVQPLAVCSSGKSMLRADLCVTEGTT